MTFLEASFVLKTILGQQILKKKQLLTGQTIVTVGKENSKAYIVIADLSLMFPCLD